MSNCQGNLKVHATNDTRHATNDTCRTVKKITITIPQVDAEPEVVTAIRPPPLSRPPARSCRFTAPEVINRLPWSASQQHRKRAKVLHCRLSECRPWLTVDCTIL